MIALEFVVYTLLILLSCNVIGFILSILPIYFKKLLKYRIQDKEIDRKVFFSRLPLIFFNILSLSLISSIGLYFIYPIFESNLNFSPLVILIQLAFILIIDDFFFYFLHRWMHNNKYILKTVHSIHHKAFSPLALEYLYVHPFEWMMGYIGPFIGIGVIGLISPVSCWAFWIYMLVRNIHELEIHSGFKTKFSQWIPFWGVNEHHDLHHAKLNGNYASTFTFWDKVFKTKMK
ncbi:MAG: sterol desaturase family protein [Flavobacteriales bacterium]|nr:sterol desaturase family protein [Flavobacteriales bacterium]